MLWVTFIFVLVTIVIALILTIVQKIFAVKEDPIVEKIDKLLPQTQCGQCGYPGCMPYAQAVANGDEINKCVPGGQEVVLQLAELLNRPVPEQELETPVEQIAIINEAQCIGCLHCVQACPVDAILGAKKQMHVIIPDYCTGCELCVDPCPVKCISMIDRTKEVDRYSALRKQINLPKAVTPSSLISIVNAPLDLTKNSSQFKAKDDTTVESATNDSTLNFNATIHKESYKKSALFSQGKATNTTIPTNSVQKATISALSSNSTNSSNSTEAKETPTDNVVEAIQTVFVNSDGRVLTDEEVAVRKARAERRARKEAQRKQLQEQSQSANNSDTTVNSNVETTAESLSNSTVTPNSSVDTVNPEIVLKVETLEQPTHVTTTDVQATNQDAKKAAIAATIARMKAKKSQVTNDEGTGTVAQENVTTSAETTASSTPATISLVDPKKAAIAAAIAKAKAKQAQAQTESTIEANSSVDTVNAEIVSKVETLEQHTHVTTTDVQATSQDEKKAAIAAAIDRMKAKKAQATNDEGTSNVAQENVTTSVETTASSTPATTSSADPKKDAIAVAIAKAKAKQAQAKAESTATEDKPTEPVETSTTPAGPKKAAIVATIAKAKAKVKQAQAQAESTVTEDKLTEPVATSSNSADPKKAAIAAAITKAKAKAKQAQAQAESTVTEDKLTEPVATSSNSADPKKAAIAAAIAKAKAKQAQAKVESMVTEDKPTESVATTTNASLDKYALEQARKEVVAKAMEERAKARKQTGTTTGTIDKKAAIASAIAKAKAKVSDTNTTTPVTKTISREVPVDLLNEDHVNHASHHLDETVTEVIIDHVATETAVEMGMNTNEQDVHPRQATYLAAIAKAKAKAQEKAKANAHKKSNARSNFASNRQKGDRKVESLISIQDNDLDHNKQVVNTTTTVNTNVDTISTLDKTADTAKTSDTTKTTISSNLNSSSSKAQSSTHKTPLFFNLNTLDEDTKIPDQENVAYVSKYEYSSDIVARLASKLQAQRQANKSAIAKNKNSQRTANR